MSCDICVSMSDLLHCVQPSVGPSMLLQMLFLFYFMAEYYSNIYVPHLLYSSVNGHLGCFHVLAIVNSSAMNFRVHGSFRMVILPKLFLIPPALLCILKLYMAALAFLEITVVGFCMCESNLKRKSFIILLKHIFEFQRLQG